MNTPATIPHIARALDGGFAAINARLDALEKRIGKPVVWPMGLHKDRRDHDARKSLAEDRKTQREVGCEFQGCGAKGGLWDYSFRREPREYRFYTLCPNGHLGEF